MGIRVLVADDHEVVRTGLASLLKGSEITIVGEATNGQEAVERADETNPDVVLMDIRMPVMDGLSLIRALRAMPDYATVPMLMLSTEHDDAILERAREAGASGFLAKPFDPDELMASVDALLGPPNVG